MVDYLTFKIRCFKHGDESSILKLWNVSLPQDPITLGIFKEKVLNDPNFDSKGCLVAEKEGKLVGFILAIVRKIPNDGLGLERDRGWLTVIFVHPRYREREIGSVLLSECLSFLRSRRRRIVYVCGLSGSAPNYFWPGVDIKNYGGAIEFLKRRGFILDHYAFNMEKNLLDFKIPKEISSLEEKIRHYGVSIRFLEPEYKRSLLSFLLKEFPGDWHRYARETLRSGCDLKRFIIALKNSTVVGYSHYGMPFGAAEECFGPIGVSKKFRRLGLGTILYFRGLEGMYNTGQRKAAIIMVDEGAPSSFYLKYGARVIRTFAIMKRKIKF